MTRSQLAALTVAMFFSSLAVAFATFLLLDGLASPLERIVNRYERLLRPYTVHVDSSLHPSASAWEVVR